MHLQSTVSILALAALVVGQASSAQRPSVRDADPISQRPAGLDRAGRVHHALAEDDVPWALGDRWKASFGEDGFTYVPFFGSDAPRNYPFRLRLQSVRIGEVAVDFAADVTATRSGDRLTYERGPVQEIYELSAETIAQSFVIDGTQAGDVELVLEVETELVEDRAQPGLQFGNELGQVEYGAAFLVRGADRLAIETRFDAERLVLHVPASLRGEGPIVIDPVLGTRLNTGRTGQGNDTQPDVAYDASSATFILVWTTMFSQTDADPWMEVLDAEGYSLNGSARAFDLSTLFYTAPRIANVNAADRFLVVMERRQAATAAVVGYLISAASYIPGPAFTISQGGTASHASPDVGGDPRAAATGAFCVTWVTSVGTGSEIWACIVGTDGTVRTPTQISPRGGYALADISQSNDCLGLAPRWCLVYADVRSATRADLCGAMIGVDGAVLVPHRVVHATGGALLFPSVSSPAQAADGSPQWFITLEQQSPAQALGLVVPSDLGSVWLEPLTAYHGIGPIRVRAETDGVRFALVSGSTATGTLVMTAATLAWWQNTGVLHESPTPLGSTFAFPRVCSKVSGGGVQGADYLIVGVNQSASSPHRIAIARYLGHSAGAAVRYRDTDCGNAYLRHAGTPYLGSQISFTLYDVGADLPGFLVGLPRDPALPLCGACLVGVDLLGPVIHVSMTARMSLGIPRDIGLLGVGLACQGYAIGSGPCGPQIQLSDTIDFWFR